jgi:hypothetical protein
MAEDDIAVLPSESPRAKPVAADKLATLNGVATAVGQEPHAQGMKLLEGAPGDGNTVHKGNPLPTYEGPDNTVTPGGLTIAAGAEVQLVPANATRRKILIVHRGNPALPFGDPADTSGPVWIGWGQTASGATLGQEIGQVLLIGGFVEAKYQGAIRARNTGSVSVRLVWTELAP